MTMALMLVLIGANIALSLAMKNIMAAAGWFVAGLYVWMYYAEAMA